jgi:threonine/homoserine/homoserine lactone efflux protein
MQEAAFYFILSDPPKRQNPYVLVPVADGKHWGQSKLANHRPSERMVAMDPANLLVFSIALLVAAASPGPGIIAVVARVLAGGTRDVLAFAVALAIGDVIWLTLSIAGLAVLAQTFHALFVAVRWIGAGYLVYLGWKMWTAPAVAPQAPEAARAQNHTSMFLAGLTLALSNPKVMLFYLALLPVIVDVRHVSVLGYLELVLVTVAVLALVLGCYIVLAGRVRSFFNSPRAVRWVHRGSAGIMMGAAAWLAART